MCVCVPHVQHKVLCVFWLSDTYTSGVLKSKASQLIIGCLKGSEETERERNRERESLVTLSSLRKMEWIAMGKSKTTETNEDAVDEG